MSALTTTPHAPVLIRADEAEHLDAIGHVLLADSSATGGALTSHRVALSRGADGAVPHRHDQRSELFYILDGAFDLLVGDDTLVARAGDLLVVPPGAAHAFAARAGHTAEALVIATPGIDRFDYFRHVVRRRAGEEPAEVLLDLQDRFDTYFMDSPVWDRTRRAARPTSAERRRSA
ncbi:MAG TPA: cupin domain-containing protein [Jatrophihabitantaceae bacterium]|jgi:quercetin dioxygenase-like cupin family protein